MVLYFQLDTNPMRRKKYVLVFGLLIWFCSAMGQSVRLDGIPASYVKPEHGIPFKSKEVFRSYEEVRDFHFPEDCDNKHFFVNDLLVSEKDFSALKLHASEVDLDQCCFSIDYDGDSVVCVNYHTIITMPICVNGKEYATGHPLSLRVFNEYDVTIKKEKRWFKKNRLVLHLEQPVPN